MAGSLAGVSVKTWGTEGWHGSNGILHFLDTELFGGSEGHASIEVTFPANAEGERLIKEYCEKDGNAEIPYRKISFKDPHGETREYYSVNFSWWPSAKGICLSEQTSDQEDERLGVPVQYADRFSDIRTEKRIYRGKLGQQTMTLGPVGVAHLGRLNNDPIKKNLVKAKLKLMLLEEEVKSIRFLLEEKLGSKKKITDHFELTKTELLMLNNLLPKKEFSNLNSMIVKTGNKNVVTRENYELIVKAARDQKTKIIKKLEKEKKKIDRELKKTIKKQLGKELDFSDYPELEKEFQELEEALIKLKENKADFNEILLTLAEGNKFNSEDESFLNLAIPGWEGKEDDGLVEIIEEKLLEINEEIEESKERLLEIEEIVVKAIGRDVVDVNALKEIRGILYEIAELKEEKEDLEKVVLVFLKNKDLDLSEIEDLADIDLASFLEMDFSELSEKENNEIAELIRDELDELSKNIILLKGKLLKIAEKSIDIDDYLTVGTRPDDTVSVPIQAIKGSEEGVSQGLNVEAMLGQMRSLLDNTGKFSLRDVNCSETVGRILEAGCDSKKMKKIAHSRALGSFGTPQEVMNKAVKIEHYIVSNKELSLFAIFDPFKPVENLGGYLLKIVADNKNASTRKRVLASVALVPVSIAAFGVFMIKGIGDPLKAYRATMAINKFAFSRKSKLLKGLSIAFIMPITGLFAIPAGVQYGIVQLIEKRKSSIAKKQSAKAPKGMSDFTRKELEREGGEALVAEREVFGNILKSQMKALQKEVSKKETAGETLGAFLQVLFDDEKSIPFFENNAQDQLRKAIIIAKKMPDKESDASNVVGNIAQGLKDKNPRKYSEMKLPDPDELKKMSISDLQAIFSTKSLERAEAKRVLGGFGDQFNSRGGLRYQRALQEARGREGTDVVQEFENKSKGEFDARAHLRYQKEADQKRRPERRSNEPKTPERPEDNGIGKKKDF